MLQFLVQLSRLAHSIAPLSPHSNTRLARPAVLISPCQVLLL
jgi:hypothetical protein